MYDWATDKFYRPDIEERHQLFEKIFKGKNEFTEQINGKVKEKIGRPLLIISSTSFTEDENFMVMIEGLDYVQA